MKTTKKQKSFVATDSSTGIRRTHGSAIHQLISLKSPTWHTRDSASKCRNWQTQVSISSKISRFLQILSDPMETIRQLTQDP